MAIATGKLTKAQIRSIIFAQIPDAERHLWSTGNLDVMIQLIMDELWGEILDEAPWHISKLDTIAAASVTSPGYIDLTASGPLTKRFYRLQKLVINQQEYSPTSPHDSIVDGTTEVVSAAFTYIIYGSQLWAFPLSTTLDVQIRYSYFPTQFTALSESTDVDWPSGFENAFIYEVLARISSTEAATNKNHAIAMIAYDRLKSRVRREYVGPSVMMVSDSPFELGGT